MEGSFGFPLGGDDASELFPGSGEARGGGCDAVEVLPERHAGSIERLG